MNGLSSYFRNPATLLLTVLVALSLMAAWDYGKQAPGLDYYVAWVAADAVENGNPNYIYDPASRFSLAVLYRNKADEARDAPRQKEVAAYRTRQVPMTATPFLYWVTAKLSTGSYERDLTNWHLLSLVLVTASILLTCRTLGYSQSTSLALLLPVLVWFTPLLSDLRVANVNAFQLGIVGLVLWLQSLGSGKYTTFLAGLVVALLVMFKPNLGAIAVLLAGSWLVRKQYLRFAYSFSGMVAGGALAVLVSSWWLSDATAWLDWLKVLERVARHAAGGSGGNYAAITQVTGNISPLTQLWIALGLSALCLAFFWWGQRSQHAGENNTERMGLENIVLIAMGCIITMLASKLVWLHYYVLLLPMFIVLLRPWPERRAMTTTALFTTRILPVIAFALLLDSPLPALLWQDSKTYWTVTTMGCTIALFLAGLWQLAYGIRDRDWDSAPGVH